MSTPDLMDYPSSQLSAAEVEAGERLLFLRKTYSKVLLGIAIFVGAIMAVHQIPWVQETAFRLVTANWWIWILLMLGVGFGVRAVARVPGIGLVGYVAYAIFMGLVVGPLTLLAEGATVPAAVVTMLIFSGLTAYVFVTKKDFSFLGGALAIGLFALIGIAIAGAITGFAMGMWYSVFGAVLFSGYILYDTSNVLHRCRTDESLPAAIELFTDVVLLFWYLLMLFMDRE